MNLEVKKVIFSGNIGEVRRTYIDSFEARERMPFPMMISMSLFWNTQFYSFYDKGELCGLIYMASIGKVAFVMFFAVPEGLRSKGYGSAILDKIQEMYPNKKLIISIEPCDVPCNNPEQRARRKAFYGRNGYLPSGYMMKLMGEIQEILIKNGEFSSAEFRAFFAIYSFLAVWPRIWKIEE